MKKKTPKVKNEVKVKNAVVPVPKEMLVEEQRMIKNGLTDVIFGGQNPFNSGVQLSQTDTLFKNNRWYLVSNMRQLLSELYVEIGLVQTIVDVPVDDGMRGGISIKSKQLSEEQIQELQTECEKENDLTKVGQAAKWNRLFGGAGIVIMTDQDPSSPLNVEAINENTPLEFRAVDMWELFWSHQNTQDYSLAIDANDVESNEFYDYYGIKLHKSRVMRMKGLEAPSFVRPRLRGWGFSVVETLVRSINQYLKATDLSFEVLDEFKLDIFKIKNLANTLLDPCGEDVIRRRVALANAQKNYQNALTMDSEDDYVQKQLSFSGLAEVMQGIRLQVASDMRMPLTKIFGISATGFNSGEDDIENYNAMVESQIRAKTKYDIVKIIELRSQQKFGFIPEDLTIEFKPLRVLSSEQQENVKTQQFNRLIIALEKQTISVKEFKEAINRENLLPVKLDTSVEELIPGIDTGGESDEDKNVEGAKNPEKPKAALKDVSAKAATPKEAEAAKNSMPSMAYLVREYEAEGGHDTYSDERHKKEFDRMEDYIRMGHHISNPGTVDEAKWTKAKEESKKEYGAVKWPFVTWLYKREGGKLA